MPKKGVVLPLGATGESDDAHIYMPSVIFINNFFYLYYSAHNGTNVRVALAISKDGINFTKKGVVIPLGAAGELDETHVHSPSICCLNGYFYLYYSAFNGGGWTTALAISKDGINFTKKGVVIPVGAAGEADDVSAFNPFVIFYSGYFYLYYISNDGASINISLAISKDGINFTKKGVVIPHGTGNEFDVDEIDSGSIFYFKNYFYLFYSGVKDTIFRTGLAISKDGINFTKKGVVIPLGASFTADDNRTLKTSVIHANSFFYKYYAANDAANNRILLAISKDLINIS